MLNYTKGRGREKNWLIEESSFDEDHPGKCEAIFTQGNGYLGLRNALEEHYVREKRGLFVTGTFNKASADEVTELPNVPDIVNTEITVNGESFSMNRGKVTEYSRTLNLYTGETIRSLTWESPKGDRAAFSFHRFVSYDNLHVIGNYIEVTALSGDLTLSFQSGIDGQVTNSGAQHFIEGDKRVLEGKYLEFPFVTTQSGVTVCVYTTHTVSSDAEGDPVTDSRMVDDRRRVFAKYVVNLSKGKTFRMEKISTVHSTRDKAYTDLSGEEAAAQMQKDGRALIKAADAAGYDQLFAASRKVWENIWKDQDIQIEGSDIDQLTIRFVLYHLQIMAFKEDGRIGIAAKGLSGEGYKGHSFWDTETFIFPYFQMAEPDVARTLLMYRYNSLPGAHKKAKGNGYAGAQYPWESAWLDDGEVTPFIVGVDVYTGKPMECWTGEIEIHITADIIYALWQYYITTGDDDFMEHYGYEMILDTALFWNSRLEWIEENGRYEIRDVIGPDEYKEHVDNNAYTNYLAAHNMELAVSVIDRLAKENKPLYEKLEKKLSSSLAELKKDLTDKLAKLYLPKPDPVTGIIQQFDGYSDLKEIDLTPYREAAVVGTISNDYSHEEILKIQAGKQADVVELLYQLEDLVDQDIKRSNYEYYEARTLHDSSLSKAIHSIAACDLGMNKEAYEMFRRAADTDMGQEPTSSDAGIHSANMGGLWQDVVMGFGGLRISHDMLRINPSLPACWQKLVYPIYWKGSRLTVTVDPVHVCIENAGEPFEAVVKDQKVTVQKGGNTF